MLVGTSDIGLFDLKATPVHPAISGVEVHAQVRENGLTRSFLSRPANAVGGEVVLALVNGLLVIIIVPNLGALRVMILGTALAVALASLSWQAYTSYNMLVDVAYPLASSFAVFLALVFVNYSCEGKAASPDSWCLRSISSTGHHGEIGPGPFTPGPRWRYAHLTLLFSDIHGFRSISEAYIDDPKELTPPINRMLKPLLHAIIEARGTISKYIGDAIVAFLNAPLSDEDHAANACTDTLNMMQRLDALNE